MVKVIGIKRPTSGGVTSEAMRVKGNRRAIEKSLLILWGKKMKERKVKYPSKA